jgi:hypothetical protein
MINTTYRDSIQTAQTDKWIAQQGIDVPSFTATPVDLLKSQKLATTLLKSHGKLLDAEQVHLLNTFLRAAARGKKRAKITLGQCRKVLNISTQVNRKRFKSYRQI